MNGYEIPNSKLPHVPNHPPPTTVPEGCEYYEAINVTNLSGMGGGHHRDNVGKEKELFFKNPIFISICLFFNIFQLVVIIVIAILLMRTGEKSTELPATQPTLTIENGCYTGYIASSNGSCYKVSYTPTTFEDAERNCKLYRGNLVSITTPEENDFVTRLFRSQLDTTEQPRNEGNIYQEYWIGLVFKENKGHHKWEWTDGSAVNYTSWAKGEPNNLDQGGQEYWTSALSYSVENYSDGKQWNNVHAGNYTFRAYICKHPKFK